VLTRAGKPVTVLIVEDHALIALDLQQMVEELGGDVLGLAHSAELGIERARALRPDIVLMDVRLAGLMDGVDGAQAIAGLPGVSLVFITGNTDPMTMARIRRIGDFAVLSKPVLMTRLEAALRKAARLDPPARACAAAIWQISALPAPPPPTPPRDPGAVAGALIAASVATRQESQALLAALRSRIAALAAARANIAARRATRLAARRFAAR
jgi:DNA-binding NarL/FixJ family response regulator